MGFGALGLDTYAAAPNEELRRLFQKITSAHSEYAILYIEEALAEYLAEYLAEEISVFRDRPAPAIIMIPGRDGSRGIGAQALRDAVARALGTDVL